MCRVTLGDQTVEAVVALVSRGMVMAVTFEAILGPFAGMMALYVTEDGDYVETFSRQPVSIDRPIDERTNTKRYPCGQG